MNPYVSNTICCHNWKQSYTRIANYHRWMECYQPYVSTHASLHLVIVICLMKKKFGKGGIVPLWAWILENIHVHKSIGMKYALQ